MKSLIILLLSVFLGTTFAQDVPSAAKAKLNTLYPKAKEVKWDKEDANFEANFEVNDVEMSILLDAKGNVLETETDMGKSALPEAVKSAINKNFAGYAIEGTAKIIRDGKTTFEAEFKKGENKLNILFSPDGKLVKKIEKQEKDKESEKAENGEKRKETK